MNNLFESPIESKKVRKGVTAYKYKNGVINIEGIKYFFHSMTSAIQQYKIDHPINKKKMKADILILFHKGIPIDQYIVRDVTVAEATFDKICEDQEILKDLTQIDYEYRLIEANHILKGLDKEIVWLTQIKINNNKI